MSSDDIKNANEDWTTLPEGAPATEAGDAQNATPLSPHLARVLEADALQANMSAIASARTGSLEAVGTAIGFANVAGDATLTASVSPMILAKGNVSVRQCYTSAVLAGGNMEITQAGAPIIVGKQLDIKQGGGIVMLAGEANVSGGFVGVLLSPKATVADDTRVLIGTKAALIIAAALLGGFAIVALVMVLGVRRVMSWRPQFSLPRLPDLSAVEDRLRHFREN